MHRFYASEYNETIKQLAPKRVLFAGSQWAKTARRLLLDNVDKISVENLMVRVFPVPFGRIAETI